MRLNVARGMNRSGSSVKETVCVWRKRSLSGKNWKLNVRGSVWRESVVNENVRNSRNSVVLRPCALRNNSVHVSDRMRELVVRMITGMVTARELIMMAQEEELEVVGTIAEIEGVLMIAVDSKAMITDSNDQLEEIAMIAVVDTGMHQEQHVMEDLPEGPVEDPDLHEMTIEEDHRQGLILDLQQIDLTGKRLKEPY